MKRICVLTVIICCLVLFSACENKVSQKGELPEETTSDQSVVFENELESILADDSFSNSEQNDAIIRLAEKEISRGDLYAEKIKNIMIELKNNDEYYADRIDDSTLKSVDEYCEKLKNEYDENSEFFDNIAMIKFAGGTAGSEWRCTKAFEFAKNYADKMESIYNEIEYLV